MKTFSAVTLTNWESIKDQIGEITLFNGEENDGSQRTLSAYWNGRRLLIVFLRRLGCVYTQLMCKQVMAESDRFVKNSIRILAVCFDGEDFKDCRSLTNTLEGVDFLIDTTCQLYTMFGFGRSNVIPGMIASLATSSGAVRRAKSMGLSYDLSGDGLRLGGAVLIEAEGLRVLYEWHQMYISSEIPLDDLFKLVENTNDETSDIAVSMDDCISNSQSD